jgi:lysophospholipase L1-like esterase
LDLVSLEAQPLLDMGVGVPIEQGGLGTPLPDRFVLARDEQTLARGAISGYNAIIARLASERGLALVDVRGIVNAINNVGLVTDGVLLTGEFVTGQGFSLDGTHFTPKAYGVITNRLLEAVNARYGSRLPPIRTSDLPGVPLISLP